MADPDVNTLIAETIDGSQTISLVDGRRISFVDLGDKDGRPLLHFHGTGFSALEALTGARLAFDAGVRLISFDRPGFGGSTPSPNRDLGSVAHDAMVLADYLGLDHFAVSGFSGGVPHALATAALADARCRHVLGINTAGDAGAEAWREISPTARALIWVMTMRPIAKRAWPWMFADIPAMLSVGGSAMTKAVLAAAFSHGSARGHDATLEELALFYRRGWGDPWQGLKAPVTLFHGRQDGLLPFAHALAAQHRGTTLVEISGKHMDWTTATVWRRLLAKVS